MEAMQSALRDVFRSERLVYRSIKTDNTAHNDFIFKNFFQNQVNFGLASLMMLKPACRKTYNESIENRLSDQLLAVLICLSPEKGAAASADQEFEDKISTTVKQEEDRTPMNKDAEEPEPIPIGMIHLSKLGYNMDSATSWRRTEIEIQISDEYQNKGYGRGAINLALDWAFAWAGMHGVSISTISFNERARALYESIGFKVEGRAREVCYLNRQWHNMINRGMLESEWEALRAKKADTRAGQQFSKNITAPK
ncbi:acyl-CoA N-acyltransferase [Pseudomassariella vexata]|uniref:Acyl-CoA N-acyltransferase n=1 Tax=Pseudomassariella vexata TaxID=1141098 RepID=A0A1Y2EAJ2_9PEZI|nr:acyl-CoA N-acyltransferase [Pseudomassariella vexata]ORY68610.1 acyl-CoA N-acyltransferase [Pseudomassariella vexata]